jgi:CHAD domain-containing protein
MTPMPDTQGHFPTMATGRTRTLEREVKFDAPLSLPLPDLRDLVGRIERLPEQLLRTAYFDTADGRLWNQGLTLRHRTVDGETIGTWTLKLPDPIDGPRLERMEVSWTGGRDRVPEDARRLVSGLVRREPLRQLVELDAVRLRLALHDDADRVIGELDDDRVAVSGGQRDGQRFRQVELELRSVDETVHTGIMQRLKEAGAASCAAPKLARALGTFGSASAQPHLDHRSSIGDVVRASISDGFSDLEAHEWRIRLALRDTAAEDVHHARVATRRLRSNLKTFRSLLDPVWVKHVRSDLKWLGSALGELRDADVLANNLRKAPPQLLRELANERASAARHLETVLGSNQYFNLLDRLHVATRTPPFALGGGDHGQEAAARRVLPALVGRRWRAMRSQVRKSGSDPTDRDLHRIRIKAKQLRYAAEAAAPVVGKPAARTASAAETVQTILGHHHDAVAAEMWLRQQAGPADSSNSVANVAEISFAAGALSADQHLRQRKFRRQWADSWKTLTTRNRGSWLE